MSDHDDGSTRKRLTRRRFIKRSGTFGAGVAFAPIALDLSACSNAKDVASGTQAMPSSSGTKSSTAAAAGSAAPSTSGSNASAQTNPGSSSGSAGHDAVAKNSGTGGAQNQPTSTNPGTGTAQMPASNTNPAVIASDAVLLGLYQGDGAAALQEAVKKLDFSWLKSGDTVLIKVATNSQYTHPTVTSPNGVRAMVAELKNRGAGRVIVADQAGVEHVRLSAMGREGKTSDMWSMNGMADAAKDAETHFFDDQGFDQGYFMATLPDGNHWPRGMYLPAIIKEADHILYMPRIGTHVLAGLSLGHKSAIGWVRDDSRHDLHNDAMNYYEKYTEINYTKEIADRFRMAVTVSEAVLLHGGPDTGTNYALMPVMVTASTRLANHDAVNASVLVTLNKNITRVDPGTMTYSAASAPQSNSLFADGFGVLTGAAGAWVSGSTQTLYTAHPFEMGITKDRAISRGWELSGGKPSSIAIVLDGAAPDDMLKSGLTTHGEGLYSFG